MIWTDETSMIIGSRQGNRTRIWRRVNKLYTKKCCRPRWKGFVSLCFGDAFPTIMKGLYIAENPKRLKRKKRLRRI